MFRIVFTSRTIVLKFGTIPIKFLSTALGAFFICQLIPSSRSVRICRIDRFERTVIWRLMTHIDGIGTFSKFCIFGYLMFKSSVLIEFVVTIFTFQRGNMFNADRIVPLRIFTQPDGFYQLMTKGCLHDKLEGLNLIHLVVCKLFFWSQLMVH